jgi:hypothetical protein
LHSRNAQGQDGGELLTDADLAPVREPARAWRNWYRILPPPDQRILLWGGVCVRSGDIMPGMAVHPSKEIAEQRALKQDAVDIAKHGYRTSEWVDAYPEGERP